MAILNSIEEQSSTVVEIAKNIDGANTCAKEVAHNVTESAKGLNEIATAFTNTNQAVTDTTKGVSQINQNAVEVAKLASGLVSIVKQFKV